MLDVAIVGGGPAGVAAALSLRQLASTASITILDDGRRQRWKPGEILSPGVTRLLESLGSGNVLREAFAQGAALPSYGSQAAWGNRQLESNDFLYSLHGNGWRVDRASFDAILLHQAGTASINVRSEVALLASSAAEDGSWFLQLQTPRGHEECQARFVIDASGRAARFATQRGSRPLCSDKLGSVCVLFNAAQQTTGRAVEETSKKHPKLENDQASFDTLIEATENGWWYSAGLPNPKVIVAFMSDTDLIRELELRHRVSWFDLFAQSEHTRLRMMEATPDGDPMIFSVHSQIMSKLSGRGWVAAGDAAMAFDPLSSQGIHKALRSGKTASFVAADFLLRGAETHSRYERLARAEYEEYEQVKRTYYREEWRWPEARFWQRGSRARQGLPRQMEEWRAAQDRSCPRCSARFRGGRLRPWDRCPRQSRS